jgi:hypothetical protein
MAGRPGRSGGSNRKSAEDHRLDGTKPRRAKAPAHVSEPLSEASRRRVLDGLTPEARRIARALLDRFEGWDEPALQTARAYALSCTRLEVLQTDPAAASMDLHRELRSNLALRAALELPPAGEA